jgi:hypothetical protein
LDFDVQIESQFAMPLAQAGRLEVIINLGAFAGQVG